MYATLALATLAASALMIDDGTSNRAVLAGGGLDGLMRAEFYDDQFHTDTVGHGRGGHLDGQVYVGLDPPRIRWDRIDVVYHPDRFPEGGTVVLPVTTDEGQQYDLKLHLKLVAPARVQLAPYDVELVPSHPWYPFGSHVAADGSLPQVLSSEPAVLDWMIDTPYGAESGSIQLPLDLDPFYWSVRPAFLPWDGDIWGFNAEFRTSQDYLGEILHSLSIRDIDIDLRGRVGVNFYAGWAFVPEPGGLILLGLGGMALLMRRQPRYPLARAARS